jgi:hypothetical protein
MSTNGSTNTSSNPEFMITNQIYKYLDKTYDPLVGKNIPVVLVASIPIINENTLIGVRTYSRLGRQIEFTLDYRKNIPQTSKEFEIIIYSDNKGLFEPNKILRLSSLDKIGMHVDKVNNYHLSDYQRSSITGRPGSKN